MKLSIRDYYAGFAMLVATVLAFFATFLPPQGVVDSSMLYLIAQFLILAATLLGAGEMYEKMLTLFRRSAMPKKEEKKDGDEDHE